MAGAEISLFVTSGPALGPNEPIYWVLGALSPVGK
jgi:hypothetical protein